MAEVDQIGALLAHYAQGSGIDEPLAELRNSTTGFYQQDGLGSTTALSNSTGTLLNSYTYDSFGNVSVSTGSFVNPYLYTGRDEDAETGLLYYRARYYDPAIGRFLSEDDIGNDEGMDLYTYVKNSPIGFRDPTGYTKYKGFSPEQEQQMRDAVQAAINKLDGDRTCDHCSGNDGPKIIKALQNATFTYKPDLGECGFTLIPGLKKTQIGNMSFDVGRCCILSSTLVHEAIHMNFGGDMKAYAIEKACFNCGTGKKP